MSETILNNETDQNNWTSLNKIWVVVSDSQQWRGGQQVKQTEVDVERLSSNMNRFLEQIGNMLKQTPQRVGEFHFEEFEISAEVTAQGTLAILGTGLQAGATGGLRFIFRRSALS